MRMMLRTFRSDNGFERLLDSEDKKEVTKELLQRRLMLVAAACTCVLLLLTTTTTTTTTTAIGVPSMHLGTSDRTTAPFEATQNHDHTIPTPLSIVDPISGKYINSLENELYQELKTVQIMEHRFLRKASEGLPILSIDTEVMDSLRQSLTVSWTLGESSESGEGEEAASTLVDSQDILALYCPPTADHSSFIEAATLEQVAATSRKHTTTVGMNENNSDDDNTNTEWFIPSFPIANHDSCEFRLFDRQDQDTLQLLATSPILHLPAAGRMPTGIHLAFSEDTTEMVIQFNTAEKGTPLAMFGVEDDDGSTNNHLKDKVEGVSHTYTADDLCGAPANVTEVGKFQDPGMLHVIRLTGLQPNQDYAYKVGLAAGQGIVWSDVFSFKSPPTVGAKQDEPYSIVVYGDQGCPADGWGPGGAWTSAMAAREDGIRAVHHFGDLSYAIGAGHIWDEWMHMVQAFAAKVPLMVGVGNHEYDHTVGGGGGKDPSGVVDEYGFMPQWGNFGMDSGGECGVPTSQRFTMPVSNNSNGVFWYSYDFASMHTIMLSSEHNMTKGSSQYEWFLADLKSVDRSLTPWLLVELHRPLYQSEFYWANNAVGVAMRYEIEHLLKEYKVDLVLGGHYHSYLRTCDGLYQSKCNNGGPMHICIGSAGAHLDAAMLYPNKWTDVFIQQEWGYGRITVANATALLYEFVKAGTEDDPSAGKVRDDVWLIRDR